MAKTKDNKKQKQFPLTEKQVKTHKLDARCMRCKVNVVPTEPSLFMYSRIAQAGNKIFTFRLAGKCATCGTNISKMVSKDQGITLAKGG